MHVLISWQTIGQKIPCNCGNHLNFVVFFGVGLLGIAFDFLVLAGGISRGRFHFFLDLYFVDFRHELLVRLSRPVVDEFLVFLDDRLRCRVVDVVPEGSLCSSQCFYIFYSQVLGNVGLQEFALLRT